MTEFIQKYGVTLLAVAIGGAFGAVCRFAVAEFAKSALGEHFPFGTLIVNVLGCFLLGVIAGLAVGSLHPHLEKGLGVGFLGALTTFSTFGVETLRHAERGQWLVSAGNIAANLFIGLIAVFLGLAIARFVSGSA